MVETAIILSVFLTILLGMLDLGLAVLQRNSLSVAARRLARQAAVHGAMAPPQNTAWGPMAYTGTADDLSEMALAVQDALLTMKPQNVSLQIDWLDGGNESGQRVQVQIGYPHEPLAAFVFGTQPWDLNAVSVVRIAH